MKGKKDLRQGRRDLNTKGRSKCRARKIVCIYLGNGETSLPGWREMAHIWFGDSEEKGNPW